MALHQCLGGTVEPEYLQLAGHDDKTGGQMVDGDQFDLPVDTMPSQAERTAATPLPSSPLPPDDILHLKDEETGKFAKMTC